MAGSIAAQIDALHHAERPLAVQTDAIVTHQHASLMISRHGVALRRHIHQAPQSGLAGG